MDPPVRIFSSQCCVIDDGPQYLRCVVGPGLPSLIQECYRNLAAECLNRQGKRILVIGAGGGDSAVHLAGRDSMKAIALAGVPPGFRLAVVAATPDMDEVYETFFRSNLPSRSVVEVSRLPRGALVEIAVIAGR